MATGLLAKPELGDNPVVPRYFQNEAFEAIRNEYKKGVKNTAIVCATGTGKSKIAGLVSRAVIEKGNRILIVCPTRYLVTQMANTLDEMGITPGIEMEEQRARDLFEPDAVVACVASLYPKRLAEWEPDYFQQLIFDEAHKSIKMSWTRVRRHFKDARLCGMSVGPDSIVELVGGCFGAGFVGSIEDAFNKCVASGISPRQWEGFDVIDFDGVSARGWTGDGFSWKPCKRILRHSEPKSCTEVSAFGSTFVATNDHSVYRATAGKSIPVITGNSRNHKNAAEIDCLDTGDLSVGDVLVGDDGANWQAVAEPPIDMIEFCAKHMPLSRVGVVCDVKSLDRSVLKKIGVSSQKIYDWRTRGAIPILSYRALSSLAPAPEYLRVEGSSCRIAPVVTMSSWAYVLGFYLGDGWCINNPGAPGRIGFSVETLMVDHVEAKLKSLAGVTWNVSQKKMPGESFELVGNNVFVANLVRHACGRVKCYEKSIPGEWIASWPFEARVELLNGMIDSDGSVGVRDGDKNRTAFVTTSIRLAKSLLSLLRSLGVRGGLHCRSHQGGGIIDGRKIDAKRPSYSVGWSTHQKNGNGGGHRGNRRRFVHEGIAFSEAPVRKLSPCATPEHVYDLEMEGHPSFVADGVLVHNTATFDRADGEDLGQLYQSVAYEYNLWKAMTDPAPGPYLSRLTYVQCDVDIDLRELRPQGDDFTDEMLEDRIGPLVEVLANAMRQEMEDRSTLVFTPMIKSAQAMATAMQSLGIKADWVSGDDPGKDKKIADYQKGELQVLCTVQLLCEGVDLPRTAAIGLCRPTNSRPLYAQILGRGTRLFEGKTDCRVIDFNYLTTKHQLVKPIELCDGSGMDQETMDIAQELMKKDKKLDLVEAVDRAEKQHKENQILRIKARQRDVTYKRVSYDPLSMCDAIGMPWRGSRAKDSVVKRATPRQVELLKKFKVQDAPNLSQERARTLLDYLFSRSKKGLASPAQVSHLIANGMPPEQARAMTIKEASNYMQEVLGWQKRA